jgi:hypothetical protein
MKVTSEKSVSFPKLGWGISAGEERETPVFEGKDGAKKTKEAEERILAEPGIKEVKNNKPE